MKIQELLDTYYEGLARKEGWDGVVAEDFRFVGGDMTKRTPAVGRAAYQQVIQRLSRLYSGLRVVKRFVDGDQAFVLVDYDWTFPQGTNLRGPVAEYWKAEGDKLQELTIFFDTLTFDRLTKG